MRRLGLGAQAGGEALEIPAAAFVVGQALRAADGVGVLDQAALQLALLEAARRAEQRAAPVHAVEAHLRAMTTVAAARWSAPSRCPAWRAASTAHPRKERCSDERRTAASPRSRGRLHRSMGPRHETHAGQQASRGAVCHTPPSSSRVTTEHPIRSSDDGPGQDLRARQARARGVRRSRTRSIVPSSRGSPSPRTGGELRVDAIECGCGDGGTDLVESGLARGPEDHPR